MGKHRNEGAIMVVETMNKDPRKGRADWADGAVGQQCELGGMISL